MSEPLKLVCPLCPASLSSVSFKLTEYIQHIRLFHSHQPNFSLTCGIRGCSRTFTNFGTFKNHVSSRHNLPRVDDVSDCGCSSLGYSDLSGNGDDNDDEGTSMDTGVSDTTEQVEDVAKRLKRSAALLLLKLKEKQKLTQVALQGVIEGVTSLFQEHLSVLHTQVCRKLEEAGVQSSSFPGLGELFNDEEAGRPFLGLETQHQQLNYYKSNLNLLEPVPVFLGERRVWKGIGRNRRYVTKKDEAFYVPLMSTLQNLLNNKIVLQEVTRGHSSDGQLMNDYCDGKVFKEHPLFTTHKNSLQINLYFDELEVCNPLGSKAKIHKLGIFYFTLGNLSPKYRSKLSSIHLVTIVTHPNLSMYGIDAVIRPFVADMKKLEEGVLFEVNGKKEKFYGTIAVVSADNLGSLALGGFKESCTAYRCCRYCMATQETARSCFWGRQFTLRNKAAHIEQCALLDQDGGSEASKQYGINRDALLNELRYFHVCNGGLVPDIMHDVLEGALAYEAKLLLVYLIKEKFFTLGELNSRLENLELGYMEAKDRPTLIASNTLYSSSNKLKQEAAQMWLLGRVLPLLIGDCVPEDGDRWLLYLKLLEIVDILFSPTTTADHASYLRALIHDHHEEFQQLYPDRSIIPKMHFMVHMPHLIVQYGPLVRHWTMRYEAKHSYFKRIAQSMGNFINISYSLAMRHQHLECYNSINMSGLGEEMEVGPGSVVVPGALEDMGVTVTSAYETKWVKIDGSAFRREAGFVYGMKDDMPQVGQISNIFIINEREVLFKAQMFTTTYDSHFHCYHLHQLDQEPSYFNYNDTVLICNKPLHIRTPRTIPGRNVVILPYSIICEV